MCQNLNRSIMNLSGEKNLSYVYTVPDGDILTKIDIFSTWCIIGILIIVWKILRNFKDRLKKNLLNEKSLLELSDNEEEKNQSKLIDSDYRNKRQVQNYSPILNKSQAIIKNKELLRSLHVAADKCNEKLYALKCIDLVTYYPYTINVKMGPEGLTPFHRVCLHGNLGLIKFMLAKGAEPLIETQLGENALCMACYYFLDHPYEKNLSCLNILYEAGCYSNMNNQWYNKFLKRTAMTNHIELTRWLLMHTNSQFYQDIRTIRSASAPPN